MTGENVAIVRRLYEAFHGGDPTGALELMSRDVVFDASARPDTMVGTGRDFVNRAIAEWIATFDDWSEELHSISEVEGGRVLVTVTQRGRGKGSGINVEQTYAVVYEIEDGLISKMTLYMTEEEALAALRGA